MVSVNSFRQRPADDAESDGEPGRKNELIRDQRKGEGLRGVRFQS